MYFSLNSMYTYTFVYCTVSNFKGKYKCMFYSGCTLVHIQFLPAPFIRPLSVLKVLFKPLSYTKFGVLESFYN